MSLLPILGFTWICVFFVEPNPSNLQDILKMKIKNPRREGDVKFGNMFPETRHLLETFYAPYNRQLALLLGDERWLWDTSPPLIDPT